MYNAERYLSEAIESVLRQTFGDFEFIIVDDHSSDRSLSIARSYHDERIRLMVNDERIGLRKSLNVAIKEARGKIIARQDADDISLPSRFDKQVTLFAEHPTVGLVGTGYLLIDERGDVLARHIFPKNPRKALMMGNTFCHGSVMFRRTVIDKLGPYSELFNYSEDYELWLRIAKSYPVENIDEALYAWRCHKGQRGVHTRRLFECEYAYNKLARMFWRSEIGINALVRLEEEDVLAMLNMREKLNAYQSWTYNMAARHLQRHRLGRASLNVWHSLIGYARHSRQCGQSRYFISSIPLSSFLVSSITKGHI